MPKVIEIPATKDKFTSVDLTALTKKRVAGYARVSTDHEEQQSSYEAQLDYFENLIKSNPSWEYAGMYSDEGITATSIKRRTGFRTMIEDAKAGKIDLIITKSVSRFARNTVDSLTTIRELKELGVEVYFEKENIHTLDAKGELLITIMSSLAQEESRSISENTTWGIRKRMADGKFSLATSNFLGYDMDDDGNLVINEEQAETVRLIYRLYIQGLTSTQIAVELQKRGHLSPMGNEKWHQASVLSILSNEKYKGDVLIQKTFRPDFLTKRSVKNTGQLKQYYLSDNHEAIIPKEIFDMVQELRKKRGKTHGGNGKVIYGEKIRCGDCGAWFSNKTWHSTDKYARVVYQCSRKYSKKNDHICRTRHFRVEEIHEIFFKAYRQLISNREQILADLEILLDDIADTSELQEEIEALIVSINEKANEAERLINRNARTASDQEQYLLEYEAIKHEYENLIAIKEAKDKVLTDRKLRYAKGKIFYDELKKAPDKIDTFDDNLWTALVDEVVVDIDNSIVVKYRNGMKVDIIL